MSVKRYEELVVWQKAMLLAKMVLVVGEGMDGRVERVDRVEVKGM